MMINNNKQGTEMKKKPRWGSGRLIGKLLF